VSDIVLALDASAAACSVALLRGRDVLAFREAPMARGHAEALMPLVMEAMAEAKLAFADLATIAVGVGPGSFTGIRIALAAARGIGLAAGRPVVGVDSFSAVAASVADAELSGRSLLVVIESKRKELFGQYFDSARRPLGEALVLPSAQLLHQRPPGSLVIAGDAAHYLRQTGNAILAADACRPDARAIAHLAAQGRAILAARPLYLRGADVTLPAGKSPPPAT
jgi:tRNA threonylcarbamoyladenosine biosynthesis protein TsaB